MSTSSDICSFSAGELGSSPAMHSSGNALGVASGCSLSPATKGLQRGRAGLCQLHPGATRWLQSLSCHGARHCGRCSFPCAVCSAGENRALGTAVPLRDARRAPPRLGQEAAQLLRAATRLLPEDFYDSGRVVAEYYQEVRDAIQDATGAVEVIVFHHIVRNEALQASPGLDNRGAGVGGYARNAHADYTARTAVGAARQSLSRITDPEVRSRCQKCRFVLVNAWRNISDLPVQQHPLAVLDAQTLKEEDLVTVELRYATFSSESLQLRPAPRHRWLYAPGMEKDELLLFKQYDSDPTQPQHAFHCALDVAVPGSPARESIEVRAVAFFAPSATSVCLEDLAPCQPTAAEVAAAILTALACAQDWPAETRKEVCRHLAMDEKGAAEGLMVAMVASNADAENPAASMPGAPAWLQEEVKACLRAAGFCEKMKSSFLKP
ncbi:unnamed protein product [Effrenium voratum]|nr:unnamed protein product [Effrenium voratum]